MHPAIRFVARRSLFIFPGIGFLAAAVGLMGTGAALYLWIALGAAMAVVWGLPFWLRRKPSAAQTTEEVGQLLRSGRVTLLHFYSDF